MVRSSGQQIGHISEELADELAPLLDAGINVTAHVTAVTGGGHGKNYGVNLRITKYPKGAKVRVEPLERWAEVVILGRWGAKLGVLCAIVAGVLKLAGNNVWPFRLLIVAVILVVLSVPTWVTGKIGDAICAEK